MRDIDFDFLEIDKKEQILTALKCVYYVANNQSDYSKNEKFTFDDNECDLRESLDIVRELILKVENERR